MLFLIFLYKIFCFGIFVLFKMWLDEEKVDVCNVNGNYGEISGYIYLMM